MRIAVLLFLLPSVASAEPPVDPALLIVRPGSLPIILSAPHGGDDVIPGCPDRLGAGVGKFVVVNDTNTDDLTEALARAIHKAMGAKPHVVIAKFQRRQLDVNRPAADAYESDRAKPYYDAYHQALSDFRTTVQRDWGRGLLLDLHGQAADPQAIFRGTQNGKTVRHLLDRFGRPALTGADSILGRLARTDHRIVPASDAADYEDQRFSGGHIVATYGSKDGGSVDAIQLELGGRVRTPAMIEPFAKELADAVAAFAKEYLPAKPLAP